ncbi:YMGG-like glycine zipper-containing protein [Pedobacter sp. P351]|uniref:YMGG-like glycine zipper-containing protein n=1 Tax=Pedobacter superstes TaxID=3133441 RepID=UPI0030A5B9A1
MKRIAIIFAFAATFAACNNDSQTKTQVREQAFKQIRDSIKLDSFQRAEAQKLEATQQKEQALTLQKSQSSSGSGSPQRTYVKGVSETYTNTPAPRKGWSKAAKGAAIGAGAGAVTGVLVDKKDGRGAVVGGLVGAGAGYVIGRSKDKKDGRVQ